jgi:hypothetical protein
MRTCNRGSIPHRYRNWGVRRPLVGGRVALIHKKTLRLLLAAAMLVSVSVR